MHKRKIIKLFQKLSGKSKDQNKQGHLKTVEQGWTSRTIIKSLYLVWYGISIDK